MKKIIETLSKFGLITNVSVDPNKYTSIEDLINKGVITIPGAKERIMEILNKAGNTVIDVNPAPSEPIVMTDESTNETEYTTTKETVVEVKEDEIVEVTEVDETEAPTEEIVDAVEIVEETTVEETVTEEAHVEEVVEAAPEETPVEAAPKKKKSTKKEE